VLIYTAADGNYALQAMVLLKSLNLTQKSGFRFVIFGKGWSKRNLDRLHRLQRADCVVEQVDVTPDSFPGIKLSRGFPLATAYNIIAPQYFLNGNNRMLYVDADVLVTTDIAEMYERELTTPVSACIDAHIVFAGSPSMWRPWQEEDVDPMTLYLNTGVMLIDGVEWLKLDITEKCLRLMRTYDMPCADQDALNLVLKGQFNVLAPRFNSMPYHYLRQWRYLDLVVPRTEIEAAIENPAILHFHRSFLGKPWNIGCAHPGRDLWRHLAATVEPRWKRGIDFEGLARTLIANRANMTELDSRTPRSYSLNGLPHEPPKGPTLSS
jgi:lipopolysaccharide biosynthesis glycosyltransferase